MLQHIVYVYFHRTYKYIYIQGVDLYVQVIFFDKNNYHLLSTLIFINRNFFQCFTYIILFNCHKNPMRINSLVYFFQKRQRKHREVKKLSEGHTISVSIKPYVLKAQTKNSQ